MVKLIDLKSETHKDIVFGTCEYCMRTSDLYTESFVFKDDNGSTHEIETGEMDMDGYDVIYDIENIADFTHFICEKEIPDMNNLIDTFQAIYEEYKEIVEERQE